MQKRKTEINTTEVRTKYKCVEKKSNNVRMTGREKKGIYKLNPKRHATSCVGSYLTVSKFHVFINRAFLLLLFLTYLKANNESRSENTRDTYEEKNAKTISFIKRK